MRVRLTHMAFMDLVGSKRDRLITVSFMRILRLREVARMTARIALEFAPDFLIVDQPLCCDDIHDVTPRVSALAGCDRLVSEPLCTSPLFVWVGEKVHNSVAFATGCKSIKNSKRCNRKIRIPIAMWPCKVKEKMTLKEVDGLTVEEFEQGYIAKDGT
ncbi:hypothetical protein Tco_0678865 [Tanacetum coccineum]|uniref:Uncharacterized protein n=1 Tax=Tanacetum coccineum TaxID=301880 RepID=A0ABQ4XG90_9ASTR